MFFVTSTQPPNILEKKFIYSSGHYLSEIYLENISSQFHKRDPSLVGNTRLQPKVGLKRLPWGFLQYIQENLLSPNMFIYT